MKGFYEHWLTTISYKDLLVERDNLEVVSENGKRETTKKIANTKVKLVYAEINHRDEIDKLLANATKEQINYN